MNIDEDQKAFQTLDVLLENLQCFLTQKVHQQIILGFLQIKKTAWRNRGSQMIPVEKRSMASVSQKNYSERKSSVSGHAGGRSLDKQSHASFDIIKNAQFFNESRKKAGNSKKQYTQASRNERGYLSNAGEQNSRLSSPHAKWSDHPAQIRANHTIVPKLVGLVSGDELSDIQRPIKTVESREKSRKGEFRNYEESIIEVDDEDDQFEDVVLNRLDKIEQKVNQMLKDKRQHRLQTASHRGPLTPNYHVSRSKLQNVGSGGNIMYPTHLRGQRNSEFYKYQDQRNNNYSVPAPDPMIYTFQNSKNTSQHPSTKKMANTNIKPHLTERIVTPSRFSSNIQNYMTDHEQYAGNQHASNYRMGLRQADTYEIYEDQNYEEGNILQKNKKLGHYRESSGNLHEGKAVQSSHRPSYNRSQKGEQKIIDYTRLKQQGTIDGEHVYKYIPLSKLHPESRENLLQKTERQISRRQQVQTMDQRGPNVVFMEQSKHSNPKGYKMENKIQRKGQTKDDSAYRSRKQSGINEMELQGSGVKAYTDQGDFVPNGDDFSVSSDGGIYSQIRQLREMTRLYGAGREKKHNYPNQNQHRPERISSQLPEDYRSQQKTERLKYVSSKNYSQHQEDYTVDQIIIDGGHPQQRIVRVVRDVPHHTHQTHMVSPQTRMSQQQYIQYTSQEPLIYRSAHDPQPSYNSQRIYMVRQAPQLYEKGQEKQLPYNPSNKSQVQTVIIRDDTNSESNRKKSYGSITSFKSIPYGRFEAQKNPSLKDSFMKQRSVEYVVEKQGNYAHKGGYNDY